MLDFCAVGVFREFPLQLPKPPIRVSVTDRVTVFIRDGNMFDVREARRSAEPSDLIFHLMFSRIS